MKRFVVFFIGDRRCDVLPNSFDSAGMAEIIGKLSPLAKKGVYSLMEVFDTEAGRPIKGIPLVA